jgi:hypothetical protein
VKRDNRELARLLSGRDGPSILEQEAVLERVLARTVKPPLGRAVTVSVAVAVAAAAALAAVVRGDLARKAEFASRGALSSAASFDVLCVETGEAGRCPSKGTIGLEIQANERESYFAAFAQASDGTVVWLVPNAGSTSERMEAAGKPMLLDRGIRLDEAWSPGRYEVVGVVSSSPLDRAAIKTLLNDELDKPRGFRVLHRTFVVEPAK